MTGMIPDADPSLSDLVAMHVDEAFRHWISAYPGSELLADDGTELLITGIAHPLGNLVLGCSLSGDAARTKAKWVRSYFEAKNIPMSWFVNTVRDREALPPVLEDVGFARAAAMPAMVLTVQDLRASTALGPGFEIEEVGSPDGLETWVGTLQQIFPIPDPMKEMFTGPFRHYGMGAAQRLRGFVALKDGDAVGISAVYRSGNVAGIYCVGTLPEIRGLGVGSALTVAAINAYPGIEMAVLQSSAMGESVYRKMGFRAVGTHERWHLPKPSPGVNA